MHEQFRALESKKAFAILWANTSFIIHRVNPRMLLQEYLGWTKTTTTFTPEGIAGYCSSVGGKGMCPMWRLWNQAGTVHLHTTNYNEMVNAQANGYVLEYMLCYLLCQQWGKRLSGHISPYFNRTSVSNYDHR